MIKLELRQIKSEDDFFHKRKPRGYYPIVWRPVDLLLLCLTTLGIASVLIHALVLYFTTIPPLDQQETLFECGYITGGQPNRNYKVYTFHQIPFALRPTRQDPRVRDPSIYAEVNLTMDRSYRWHDPVPTQGLEACYLATRGVCTFQKSAFHCKPRDFSPGCVIATTEPAKGRSSRGNDTGSKVRENCLYLDISTPSLHRKKAPVVVIVHGAGFLYPGSMKFEIPEPFMPIPEEVASLDMVFVRIQYRFGIFGTFYALDDKEPGKVGKVRNFGLRDVLAGLRWVQRNIDRFGGDPDSVTFLGQGTGATIGLALLTRQKQTKEKLFHRAWLASGSTVLPKYDDGFFGSLRSEFGDLVTKDCARASDKCKRWDKLSDVEKMSNKEEGFFTENIRSVSQSQHFDPEKVFGNLTDFNSSSESAITWVGTEEDPDFSVDPSVVSNALDDIPIVMTSSLGELDGYPGFKEWFTKPLDLIIEILASSKLLSLLKPDPSEKNKEERIKKFILPIEEEVRKRNRRQLPGLTVSALLSVLRFLCPQYHLAKLQTKRRENIFLGFYMHRQDNPFQALLFPNNLKSTFFHGMDILLLFGTYANYNPINDKDSLMARSLGKSFSKFVTSNSVLWNPWSSSGEIGMLSEDKIEHSELANDVCERLKSDAILKMAKKN